MITNDGGSTKEVDQGNTAIRQLNVIFCSNNISRDTKIRIYKTTLESIGAELWVIN